MTNRPIVHNVASSLSLVMVFALIALLNGPIVGQSGRRGPKTSVPAPTPAPPDVPHVPEEKKPASENKAALTFIVGIDRGSGFSYVPTYFYDTVLRACAERLDNAPSVSVTVANRELNRAEAIKRAKAETESYVVWMQLRGERGVSQSGDDLREIYLDYLVYAPTTAKTVTNGRTYQQMARAGGVIAMPPGRGSVVYSEQLLKQAARDAADRILSAMNASGRKTPG